MNVKSKFAALLELAESVNEALKLVQTAESLGTVIRERQSCLQELTDKLQAARDELEAANQECVVAKAKFQVDTQARREAAEHDLEKIRNAAQEHLDRATMEAEDVRQKVKEEASQITAHVEMLKASIAGLQEEKAALRTTVADLQQRIKAITEA
jgi:chromosome segregation ATPase